MTVQTATAENVNIVPGLSAKATKLAKRIQALQDGRTYFFTLKMHGKQWELTLLNKDGVKFEVIE